jgi:hypothetical protein
LPPQLGLRCYHNRCSRPRQHSTIKARLFSPPVGRIATNGDSFATANHSASPCCSVRNWAWSSHRTALKAFRMSWSFPVSKSGFSRGRILGPFNSVSSLTSTAPFLSRDGWNNGSLMRRRNLCHRWLTCPKYFKSVSRIIHYLRRNFMTFCVIIPVVFKIGLC